MPGAVDGTVLPACADVSQATQEVTLVPDWFHRIISGALDEFATLALKFVAAGAELPIALPVKALIFSPPVSYSMNEWPPFGATASTRCPAAS